MRHDRHTVISIAFLHGKSFLRPRQLIARYLWCSLGIWCATRPDITMAVELLRVGSIYAIPFATVRHAGNASVLVSRSAGSAGVVCSRVRKLIRVNAIAWRVRRL